MRRLLALVCATIASLTALLALAMPSASAADIIVCTAYRLEGTTLGQIPPPVPLDNVTCVIGPDTGGIACLTENVWLLEEDHVYVMFCGPSV